METPIFKVCEGETEENTEKGTELVGDAEVNDGPEARGGIGYNKEKIVFRTL